MKKTKIMTAAIGMCLCASLFAGCGGQTQETAAALKIDGGQTQISVENQQGTEAAVTGAYYFTYNGYKIVPGSAAEPVLDVLGEPADEPFEGASCAGPGLDIIYEYSGFTLYTHELNGYEYIRGIEIENSLIDCGGVAVGDSISQAKQVFGAPETEDDYGISYSDGATKLEVITDGADTIVLIRYTYKEAAE